MTLTVLNVLKGMEPLRHMTRIDQTTVANKMFENRGGGIRKVGRPRMRQLEDADNDPPEVKVKTWRQTTHVHPRRTMGQGSWSAAQLSAYTSNIDVNMEHFRLRC